MSFIGSLGGPNSFTLRVKDKVIGKVGSAQILMDCRANAPADPTPTNPAPGGFTEFVNPLVADIDLTSVEIAAVEAGSASLSMTVRSLVEASSAPLTGDMFRQMQSLRGLSLSANGMNLTVESTALHAAKDGTSDVFLATVDCPSITFLERSVTFRRTVGSHFTTDNYQLEIQAPGGFDGSAPINATITRGQGGPTESATLTKSGSAWHSPDDSVIVTLSISGSSGPLGLTCAVTSSTLGANSAPTQALESGNNTGSFSSANLLPVVPSADPSSALHASYPDLQWQDDKEVFQAFVLEVEGPAAVISSADFRMPTLSGDRKIVQANGKWVMATAGGDQPESLIHMSIGESRGFANNPIKDYIELNLDVTQQQLAFLLGFIRGFAGGGGALITGAGEMIADTALTTDLHLLSVFQYIPSFFARRADWLNSLKQFGTEAGHLGGDRTLETVKAASEVAKVLGGMTSALYQRQGAVYEAMVTAIVTGNRADLGAVLSENAALMEMAFDVVDELAGVYATMDSYPRGQITGRAIFEMWALLAPFSKGFQAGTVGKTAILTNIIGKLKAAEWLKNGPNSAAALAALDRVLIFSQRLATTKCCFVAGTPIKISNGWKPIEAIKSGDQVWSKDSQTGKMEYRSVAATVVTHPSTLVHIFYQSGHSRRPHSVGFIGSKATLENGGAEEPPGTATSRQDEELVCTREHPFFVLGRGSFIQASGLRVGDRLVLADGENTQVTAIAMEDAAEGQAFTTYNFEVSGSHTYFAGRGGIWVHNSNVTPCDRVFTLLDRFLTRNNNKIWAAFANTRDRIEKLSDATILRVKLFNEARRKYFDENLFGDVGPWRTIQGQNLPVGVVGDPRRLGSNMSKILGIDKPPGMASHHIVEKADNPVARAIIERAGLHIDEAANGVWLPGDNIINEYAAAGRSEWLDGLGPRHAGSHTGAYSLAVEQRLTPLDGQGGDVIRDALQKIAKELAEGTFPW